MYKLYSIRHSILCIAIIIMLHSYIPKVSGNIKNTNSGRKPKNQEKGQWVYIRYKYKLTCIRMNIVFIIIELYLQYYYQLIYMRIYSIHIDRMHPPILLLLIKPTINCIVSSQLMLVVICFLLLLYRPCYVGAMHLLYIHTL